MKLDTEKLGHLVLSRLDEIQNFLEQQIDESKEDLVYRIDSYYEVNDAYNTLYRSLHSKLKVYKDELPGILEQAQYLIKAYIKPTTRKLSRTTQQASTLALTF